MRAQGRLHAAKRLHIHFRRRRGLGRLGCLWLQIGWGFGRRCGRRWWWRRRRRRQRRRRRGRRRRRRQRRRRRNVALRRQVRAFVENRRVRLGLGLEIDAKRHRAGNGRGGGQRRAAARARVGGADLQELILSRGQTKAVSSQSSNRILISRSHPALTPGFLLFIHVSDPRVQ